VSMHRIAERVLLSSGRACTLCRIQRKAWLNLVLVGKSALQALDLRRDDAPRLPQ
jgi:hypothetical protein